MDKCKWVDSKLVHCSGWRNVALSDMCKRMIVTAPGKPSFHGLPTLNVATVSYCFCCGEPLKEPIPERHDPYMNVISIEDTFNDVEKSLLSAHDRIDYILKRLENELDR